MIKVRYLLAASIGGEEFDYAKLGSLPVIPNDFDGTNSVMIGQLKYFISDVEITDGSEIVEARVQLYGEDMPDDKMVEQLVKEGWTRVEESA